jgi:hypothetical protein
MPFEAVVIEIGDVDVAGVVEGDLLRRRGVGVARAVNCEE